MRRIATTTFAALLATVCIPAVAKLPPPTEAAKAKAADTAARAAWSDKVSLYQICLAMDRVAEVYRSDLKSAGKQAPVPMPTAPCADPGAYTAPVTPSTSKPLEASEAHSPAGTATSPPSTNTPAAQMGTGSR